MNVFVLDLSPSECARMHNDKHVVKMILEYAQLMCTAHHVAGSAEPCMYKPTHINHPCARWVREKASRYRWLYALFVNLCDEYTHRYGKIHLTDSKLQAALLPLPANLRGSHEQSYTVDAFALAMPDKYKDLSSAVSSYREYYIGEKQHLATWTNRETPKWWRGEIIPYE